MRTGRPKAIIVACSRARSSTAMLVVLNAISSASNSVTSAATFKMPTNSSRVARIPSTDASGVCAEATCGTPRSARRTSSAEYPSAGLTLSTFVVPGRPKASADAASR